MTHNLTKHFNGVNPLKLLFFRNFRRQSISIQARPSFHRAYLGAYYKLISILTEHLWGAVQDKVIESRYKLRMFLRLW